MRRCNGKKCIDQNTTIMQDGEIFNPLIGYVKLKIDHEVWDLQVWDLKVYE